MQGRFVTRADFDYNELFVEAGSLQAGLASCNKMVQNRVDLGV